MAEPPGGRKKPADIIRHMTHTEGEVYRDYDIEAKARAEIHAGLPLRTLHQRVEGSRAAWQTAHRAVEQLEDTVQHADALWTVYSLYAAEMEFRLYEVARRNFTDVAGTRLHEVVSELRPEFITDIYSYHDAAADRIEDEYNRTPEDKREPVEQVRFDIREEETKRDEMRILLRRLWKVTQYREAFPEIRAWIESEAGRSEGKHRERLLRSAAVTPPSLIPLDLMLSAGTSLAGVSSSATNFNVQQMLRSVPLHSVTYHILSNMGRFSGYVSDRLVWSLGGMPALDKAIAEAPNEAVREVLLRVKRNYYGFEPPPEPEAQQTPKVETMAEIVKRLPRDSYEYRILSHGGFSHVALAIHEYGGITSLLQAIARAVARNDTALARALETVRAAYVEALSGRDPAAASVAGSGSGSSAPATPAAKAEEKFQLRDISGSLTTARTHGEWLSYIANSASLSEEQKANFRQQLAQRMDTSER